MNELELPSSLGLQMFAMNLSGILPPRSCSKNRCKKLLYEIFTIISIIWFAPAIFFQLIHLYQNLDNIETATGILFQVSCYISTWIIFIYFVWNRTILFKLIASTEKDFIVHMKKVGSPERRKSIFIEAYKKFKVIAYLMMGLCFLVEIAWGVIPCVIGYVEYFINPEAETVDKARYFGLSMWLPENVNKSPNYEMMHVFHFIAVYTVVSNITGCYMTMFVLAFHTTTLYKVLCAAFEDVDFFVNSMQLPEHDSSKYLKQTSYFPSNGDTKFNTYNYQIKDVFEHSNIDSNDSIDKKNIPSKVASSDTKTQAYSEEQNKLIQRYLMDCIEFHQDLIRYTNEVNDLLSPVMLVFFVFSEAMMCLSTFQLALGEFNEKKFKFLWSVLLASVWPLLVCLYGDDLMSLAVKQSVYNCRWYNRTTEFNKLLKMVMLRAQKPVTLKAGKFYIASLETFSDISHKVYAYFTLLKQMYDN